MTRFLKEKAFLVFLNDFSCFSLIVNQVTQQWLRFDLIVLGALPTNFFAWPFMSPICLACLTARFCEERLGVLFVKVVLRQLIFKIFTPKELSSVLSISFEPF